jgi:uncharacterized UPF0160 family protein
MSVVLHSGDVHALEDECHASVCAKVTHALVPQSSVSRRRTNTFVSKKGYVLTGKSLKVR